MQHQESPQNGSPVAIGIDLGTSKCCVAAVRDGRAHVLENEFGQRTTPSWVAFNSQQRLVGGAALDQAVVNCANTVSAVKRTLGRTYDQVKRIPSVCRIKKCCPNCIKFQYCVSYKKSDRFLSPEQITAMMLTKMRDIAETSLGRPVKQAVISVPACYDYAQRAAIMNAAKVAGLEVLQLINETTAAGIAFEDNQSVKTPVTIAVVDFGAGKLDISVMKVEGKSIKVIGASGTPFLGGCTVDEVLVGHCVKFIQQKFGNKVNFNDKVGVKLRLACEKAKKTLSLLPEARVCIESIVEDSDVTIPVSRQDICELFNGEIRKTIVTNFRRIFKNNSMEKHNIDKVVLVGGSTRIPAVKSILEEYFGSHKLDQTVNQDEAVAQGAALRAAALSGAVTGIEVADVLSFDICYSKQSASNADILINKFTSLPCIVRHGFKQLRGTKLLILQRTYSFTGSYCDVQIGLLELNRSLSSKSNRVTGDLDFHLDESGILHISVHLKDDQSTCRFEPNDFQSCDVNRWMEEEEQFRSDTNDELKRVDAEVELESLCFDVQNALSKLESMEDISERELESFRQALSKAMNWMTNDIAAAQLSEISGKIAKLLNVKTDVDRKLDTVQKKAIAKEAAKKEAEMKLKKKILDFESLLSGVICALQDSDLEGDFYPQMLQRCKDEVSLLMNFKENIESASTAEVSQKLEELTLVKREVDKLKADAAREKTRIEAENEAARKQKEEELLETRISEFESLLSEVKFALHDTIFAMYSNQQFFKSCELKLNSLLTWKERSETVSLTLLSQKFQELTQLKREVDQMKTEALEREKEAVEKQKEVELRKEIICSFKSLLCEVKETLNDLYPARSVCSSKFWSCKTILHPLEGWRTNIETASVTLVSKKLEELTQLKHEVDQLKTDVECHKSQETKEVADATLVRASPELQTGLRNSSNSSPANGKVIRNVAMSSILDKNKLNKRECSLFSRNSSGGSVESPLVLSASNHDHAEMGRSKSVNRPAMEGEGHRSRNGSRSSSVDVANEQGSRLESGQSFERLQPSENLKNGQPSLPRSRQNSVDDLTKHRSISRSRKGSVDQNGEHRSSRSRQPSGNEDMDYRSQTTLNSEEKYREQRRSSQERCLSQSRLPSEHEEHSFRSHNSGEEGEQKVSSSWFHLLLGSSSEGERRHQLKASYKGTASEGPHLDQRGSSDRCTEQSTSARGTGSSLDQLRKSAVGNSATLPNKHSPRRGLASSKEHNSSITCQSKGTQTALTTTSARTQTDVALLENGCQYGNETSSNDKLKVRSEEEEEKIRKLENLGILWPWLEIMESAMSNMVNCEQCKKYRFSCCVHHLNNGFKEVSRVLNLVPGILSKNSLTKTGEINWNKPTTATLEPAKNAGASQRYTTPNYPWKDNELSNVNLDSAQGSAAVPHQSSTGVSDTRSSVGGSFPTPEGPAGVNVSDGPVYQQSGRSSATETPSYYYASGPYYRSESNYVPRITAQYEELNKK